MSFLYLSVWVAALIAITTIRQYPAQDNAVLLEERHTRSFGGYPTNTDGFAREYPMNSGNADFSTILNRILDTAADNLRIAKILVQMGLDPNNITYDALFNWMLAIVLAHLACQHVRSRRPHLLCRYLADAYHGAAAHREHGRLYILRRLWRALRKHRDFYPASAVAADQCNSPPPNAQFDQEARIATEGDTSLEWLKPFMTERKYRRGINCSRRMIRWSHFSRAAI